MTCQSPVPQGVSWQGVSGEGIQGKVGEGASSTGPCPQLTYSNLVFLPGLGVGGRQYGKLPLQDLQPLGREGGYGLLEASVALSPSTPYPPPPTPSAHCSDSSYMHTGCKSRRDGLSRSAAGTQCWGHSGQRKGVETLPCSGKGVARGGGTMEGPRPVWRLFQAPNLSEVPILLQDSSSRRWLTKAPASSGDTQRRGQICQLTKRQKQPVRGARRQAWWCEVPGARLGGVRCQAPGSV